MSRGTVRRMADPIAVASLWTGVGAFVVSAATLGLVIRAEVRAARVGAAVYLTVSPFGTATVEGERLEVWEISNSGTENASISFLWFVGCEHVATEDYPPFKVLLAGQSRRLLVKSDNIGNAWVLIGFAHNRDRRWATFQWFAPDPGPVLTAAMDKQYEQVRTRRDMRRLLRRVHPVGPDGVRMTRIRTGAKLRAEDLSTATSLTHPDGPGDAATREAGPPESTLSAEPGGPGIRG